ncbi:hypothetical protein [Paenibacillus sp. UMB4589-SE434]|uniref:hypothetical protein n=1 Tax=Paenibacillus sp. UMB4589-SE434 TaxID=3046314 RepID=UPI0025500B64|nr:hypothetical protein [Paenibacillus sp. UMB4589-SE434]MDK8182592.1 hypothetical protein [Paenibacillus sp. UMB4589-SE434]
MKMNILRSKKIGFTVFLLVGLMVATSGMAFAYSASYSFEIGWQVTGEYDKELGNYSTSTKVSADTFSHYTGQVLSDKEHFAVKLDKNWSLTSYDTGDVKADGRNYTKNFGTVDSGTYAVNVRKTTGNGNLQYVSGSGTINQ